MSFVDEMRLRAAIGAEQTAAYRAGAVGHMEAFLEQVKKTAPLIVLSREAEIGFGEEKGRLYALSADDIRRCWEASVKL